ncbi:unnamed protein product [Sphenostylis stenocarpa]|uniref:Uncharacterized protein n=1 Tax=Sphenostylis stenocarpa TaxID=92480 RepID=A0AA86W5X4_9FABA|nr:unnamed protein product [Sphenostylis stenocarpa]
MKDSLEVAMKIASQVTWGLLVRARNADSSQETHGNGPDTVGLCKREFKWILEA